VTPIFCGEQPALLLGPVTVDPPFRSGGIGEALVMKSLGAARAAGHRLVLLVGDMSYYGKMGFLPCRRQAHFRGPRRSGPAALLRTRRRAFEGVKGKVRRAMR